MKRAPMELAVERIVAGGDGLARLDGRVVFVSGALPGERVLAEEVSAKRDFAKARVLEVLEPSPFRSARASESAAAARCSTAPRRGSGWPSAASSRTSSGAS